MATKTVLLFCAQVFLLKTITAYCIDAAWPTSLSAMEGMGWAAQGYACEAPLMVGAQYTSAAPFLGAYDLTAFPSTYGGGFAISSASPISPYGVSVVSENAIEGILAVGGELPFLGTVALEGALPTAGAGTISYGCGNGNVGMISESALSMAAANGFGWPGTGLNYAPTTNGYGYSGAWANPATEYGYGCGAVY